jgi:hypothetical protein
VATSALIPPSEHRLSSAAVKHAYVWLAWGTALALGLLLVIATHLFVPRSELGAVLKWVSDWLTNLALTNLPKQPTDIASSVRPGRGSFYLALFSVATLLVRVTIALTPLHSLLRRYSAWLVMPGLEPLSMRIINRSEFAPFAGDRFFEERDGLVRQLLRLTEDEHPYGIIVLSGPSGIGKSRLALAWLAELGKRQRGLLASQRQGWQIFHPARWRGRRWDAGFLGADDIAELLPKGLMDWQPLRPTAVVLDATELPEEAWRLAEASLRRHAEHYLFPIRVLLLSYQPHRFANSFNDRSTSEETSISLSPLGPVGATSVYARTAQGRRLSGPQTQRLIGITGGVPILVRMVAAQPHWFEAKHTDDASNLGAFEVLDRYAGRVVETCGTTLFGTEPGRGAFPLIVALPIATLARRLEAATFRRLNQSQIPAHPAIRMTGTILSGVEPPLLGLAFLFRVDQDAIPATRTMIARRAWEEAPDGVASMLRHFWLSVARAPQFSATDGQPGFNDPAWFRLYDRVPTDANTATKLVWLRTRFELLRSSRLDAEDRLTMEQDVAPTVADVRSGSAPPELNGLVARLWLSQIRDGDETAWPSLDALHERVGAFDDDVHDAWLYAVPAAISHHLPQRADEAVALFDHIVGKAVTTGAPRTWLGAAWSAVALISISWWESSGKVADLAGDIFRQMPPHLFDEPEIAAARAGFLVNAIADYGTDERWEEIAAARLILDDVAARFSENSDIQLELAKAAVNAIYHCGAAQRWEDLAAARLTLGNIAARFPENLDIQLCLAKGAVNAITDYGTAQRWEGIATARLILDEVAARFPENPDIQLELAKGAVNAIYHYGTAQRWDGIATAHLTLDDIAARFPGNPNIQLELAKGAVIAIYHYGTAERWEGIATARLTLEDVAARFPENPNIQLELAKGAVNTIYHYGTAQRWEDIAAARLTLDAVAARFPENSDIQLRHAMGAVNAIADYGTTERWEDIAAARLTLDNIAAGFPDNPDIQLELAKGAFNAIYHYGTAQRWEDIAAACLTLDDVAAWFPENPDIQLCLARGGCVISKTATANHLGREQIALAARRCPTDDRVQALAHEYGLSFAEQL